MIWLGVALYLMVGFVLVQGTLYISQYDLGDCLLDKWKVLGLAIVIWPIFIALMVGYWMWVAYHSVKHYVRIW